jgi:hypothetical protein
LYDIDINTHKCAASLFPSGAELAVTDGTWHSPQDENPVAEEESNEKIRQLSEELESPLTPEEEYAILIANPDL